VKSAFKKGDRMAHNNIDAIIACDKERYARLAAFRKNGVIIVDPFTTHIADDVVIGKGTTIYPCTIIERRVRIGKNCSVGPFARIRSNVTLEDKASIGNFVEVVRSTIGKGSKVKHLTYIGDTKIEKKVNVGAGTIIANYDGKEKNMTLIKEGAFIGSGSILVAPVSIGRKAMTGAGAVVTRNKNVADRAVVVGVPAHPLERTSRR
jgi:bifunctional UDP-N-acetylglucosamine pyrophosphorylase / glucosamine-1-phosphate N-acetyltransferase